MRRLLAPILALLFALAGVQQTQASAVLLSAVYSSQITAPVQLGATNAAAGGSTLTLTTSANSPAGALIVVFASSGSVGLTVPTISSLTDSNASTYTAGNQVVLSGTGGVTPYYCQNCPALNSGSTITVTFNNTGMSMYIGAVSVTGIVSSGALDVQGAGTSTTGTTPSIATGTLARPNEIVFGFVHVDSGAGDSFTEAPGFTSDTPTSLASHSALHSAYRITNGTGSVTYAPVLGTSHLYGANVIGFKGL